METENIQNEIEIDIVGLLYAILNKLAIIILIGILTGGLAFAYSQYFVEPQYTATTKVYILSKQDPTQKTLTTQDLAFATYLTNDYQVLLTSEPVLQEVKEKLNLDQSTEKLASMIKVELQEDTRIMNISVTSTDPKLAKKIADTVRDVANDKTRQVMDGIEAVNPIDEAKLPKSQSSPNVRRNALIGFILGFAISIIVVIIMFIVDDTIKTTDDIENRLGISVLASIPLKSAESNKKKKDKNTKKNAYEYNPASEEINDKAKTDGGKE